MTYAISRTIKAFICLVFVLFDVAVNAQVNLVQQSIDKIESKKTFSYQSIEKQKDYTNDTLIMQHKDFFKKSPEDKIVGYFFSMENIIEAEKSRWTDLYNGQKVIHIDPTDSTYEIGKIRTSIIQGTLLGQLNWIKRFLEKNPSKILMKGDTTVNSITCSHLIINTYDTIINKEHCYTRINLFIDKLSGVPTAIISKSRNTRIGDVITDYYTEIGYFNYKFNEDNIDIASMTIPNGFHLRKKQPSLNLLTSGTNAPDWTLYDSEGKKISLTQMKGKVILLDFFFIGCTGCMQTLKPLNKLDEKYKNETVEIVSMTFRDSKKSVTEFKKKFNIKYPIYLNAGDVVKLYQVEGFPTFYFIDKEGKIANVIVGSDDFEAKSASIINNLLNKS